MFLIVALLIGASAVGGYQANPAGSDFDVWLGAVPTAERFNP